MLKAARQQSGSFCTSLGSWSVVTLFSTLSHCSVHPENKDRGEVSILLISPHRWGSLEENMSMPNHCHINYRLINPGKNSIGLFIEV